MTPEAIHAPGPGRAACYACRAEARFDTLPPRERIAADPHWRTTHALGTALPGRLVLVLVLVPRRHVTAVHDLTGEEAATLWSGRSASPGRCAR
ncbi:hypothetical protein ACIRF8_10810 [Streptomyces sp. NPDC102406]|uniref:hypothetical protein n=1 Tax=Streptomyces sp. NPDC102406 TaxID=3366171 RepID=UPI003815BC4A